MAVFKDAVGKSLAKEAEPAGDHDFHEFTFLARERSNRPTEIMLSAKIRPRNAMEINPEATITVTMGRRVPSCNAPTTRVASAPRPIWKKPDSPAPAPAMSGRT